VDLVGNWLTRSDYEGDARSEAVAFSIGNIGYVGTGYNYNNDERLKDFWAYDADQNYWRQIADLDTAASSDKVAEARSGAVAFAAAGKGYVGTGSNGQKLLNDFWVYDPENNTWNAIAPFIGSARSHAVAFSINNIGYVGTGNDGSDLKDFYAYNPGNDTWEQKISYQSKVKEAVGFVLDGMGYICTGYHNGYNTDLYMYNPTDNTWTKKKDIDNVSDESYDDSYAIKRSKAVAFTVGTKAYVTSGDYSGIKIDVWEYDATTDLWTTRTNFEGSPRKDAVAFSTANGNGFVATGLSGTTNYDDLWEFKPTDPYVKND
jgi:N-acetylneuraminic acid mutarotase